MKKNFCFLFGLLMLMTACGDSANKAQESASNETEQEDTNQIQKMRDYKYDSDISWNGGTYHYCVERQVDDSLDFVTDDTGERYADNYIVLQVTKNGQAFFKHTFRKKQFTDFLTEDFKKHAILEGMAFDRADEQGLRFSVSISYPMSDMYIPLLITIARDGTYQIQRDPVLDNVVETIDSLEE